MPCFDFLPGVVATKKLMIHSVACLLSQYTFFSALGVAITHIFISMQIKMFTYIQQSENVIAEATQTLFSLFLCTGYSRDLRRYTFNYKFLSFCRKNLTFTFPYPFAKWRNANPFCLDSFNFNLRKNALSPFSTYASFKSKLKYFLKGFQFVAK